MSKRSKIKIIVALPLFAGLIFAGMNGYNLRIGADTVKAMKSIEDSCQYPGRWTNPPGGCDNSDPAVPECIRAMESQAAEAKCIADFVAENSTGKDATPPYPDRPYYDGAGNQYDYQGNLITPAPQEAAPVNSCQQ